MASKKNQAIISVRRLSRLNAVQILYQHEQTNADIQEIIHQYDHYTSEIDNNFALRLQADKQFLQEIVLGTFKYRTALDQEISCHLSSGWRLERLSSLTRNILRLAVYELEYQPLIPTAVIINEYIEITKDFFDEPETAFVNGILDVIARNYRGSVTN